MYGKQGSWRNIWHYIWKAVDKDNTLSFEDLYDDPYTQQLLAQQLHNLGPDITERRFKDMFTEIKQSLVGGYEEEEEFDEGADDEMVTESLYNKIRRQKHEKRQFNAIMESIFRRIR